MLTPKEAAAKVESLVTALVAEDAALGAEILLGMEHDAALLTTTGAGIIANMVKGAAQALNRSPSDLWREQMLRVIGDRERRSGGAD